MKYLIVGRSGTGKDTLANLLVKKGLTVLKSYTTRPRRYEKEDTHEFITPDEAALKTGKIATTVINGYEYFATKAQLEACDVYIIDPNGLYELVQNCPEISFHTVFLTADEKTLRNRAVNRGADKTREADIYDARKASEDTQFSLFEEEIQCRKLIAENASVVYQHQNILGTSDLENFAAYLYGQRLLFQNLLYITKQSIDLGIIIQESKGEAMVASESGERRSVPLEQFVDMLLGNKEGFEMLMHSYLSSTLVYDNIEG